MELVKVRDKDSWHVPSHVLVSVESDTVVTTACGKRLQGYVLKNARPGDVCSKCQLIIDQEIKETNQ